MPFRRAKQAICDTQIGYLQNPMLDVVKIKPDTCRRDAAKTMNLRGSPAGGRSTASDVWRTGALRELPPFNISKENV